MTTCEAIEYSKHGRQGCGENEFCRARKTESGQACRHTVKVLKSGAGWYIGTYSQSEGPMCRLTNYFPTEEMAQQYMDEILGVQQIADIEDSWGTSKCRVCGADVRTQGPQQDVVCGNCEKKDSKPTHCELRGAANCKACSDEACTLRVAESD